MRAPPARFLIKTFLVTLNAIPTEKVLSIVRADELDHVIRFAITTFAAMNGVMFRSFRH